MTKKLFVIGDIHGEYDLLEKQLQHVDDTQYQLVLLGDLIDRGPKVKQTIETVMVLVKEKGAVCLKGNHEDIFLRWLNDPEEKMDWYRRNGGQATLEDLLGKDVFRENSPVQLAQKIREQYPHIIAFFEQLPLFYETSDVICVHAGVDLELDDWRQTSERDFLWIRDEFHQAKNTTTKTIIFGHTPVQTLYQDEYTIDMWLSDNKIGLDGGAVYERALLSVVMADGKIEQSYQYKHPNCPEIKKCKEIK